MKKTLLTLVCFASLTAIPVRAAQFWYDSVSEYTNNSVTLQTGGSGGAHVTNWFSHLPGSLTTFDLLATNVNYTSGAAKSGEHLRVNGLNSEYIMRLFDATTTNVYRGGILYASFVANANYVPSGGAGTYFAAFDNADTNNPPQYATNGFDFRGRVFQIGNSNTYPFTTTLANTFRYGVANAAGDPAQGGGPSIQYVPIDLIKNVDYQVVLKYDIDNAVAYLWVNPSSEGDSPVFTTDIGPAANGLAGFLFRQRTGGGTVDVRDIVVGDSFADVMTNSAALSPVLVATNFNTVSNYSGNPALLEVFASSLGGGPLSYQWYQISGGTTNQISGANSQTYVVSSLSSSDVGNYFCTVANSGGVSTNSTTNFSIAVNTTLTSPTFKSQPANTNGVLGASLTLACSAVGTGPLSFQWSFNGTPLTDGSPVTGQATDHSLVSGSQSPTLVITGLSTNETGNFAVTVSTGASGVSPTSITSTNALVTVNPARAVSIAYIRSLEDTTTWQVKDTTSIFAISNAVVTMYTNVTSGTTASYYIQDATGGLDMFVTGDSSFRPQLGDLVSLSGTLSSYNNSIELLVDSSNPYQYYQTSGHTNVLPAPVVFGPLSLTNNAGLMETNIEGKIVMLTNVWFNGSLSVGTGNTTLIATNAAGMPIQIYFPAGTDKDVASKTIANRFAWTITGVMAQFKSSSYSPAGYEVYVTRFGDIVTAQPAAPVVSATRSGNSIVLNWMAVPYAISTPGAYAYSVLAASSLTGPYQSVASGLTFNTTNGAYTDTVTPGAALFYKVTTP